jgi:hypothetical protein
MLLPLPDYSPAITLAMRVNATCKTGIYTVLVAMVSQAGRFRSHEYAVSCLRMNRVVAVLNSGCGLTCCAERRGMYIFVYSEW